MKSLKLTLLLSFLLPGMLSVLAQPYTLDKEVKPIELALKEDTRKGHEGEKGIVFFNRVSDTTMYHFVSGHSMFQFVDVLVTSLDGTPLEVSLNQDVWNDEYNKQSTARAEDNTVNFRLRAEGKFGIKIETENPSNSLYSIAVLASPERKGYLGSVFTKIKDSEITAEAEGAGADDDGDDNGGGGNTLLYIALGVALLVIGLLAGKLMGRKRNNTTVIILFLLAMPLGAMAQRETSTFLTIEEFERYKEGMERDRANMERKLEILEKERAGMDKGVKDLNSKLSSIRKRWEEAKNLYSQYNGLSSCISSTPPAGSPSIPSICTDIVYDEDGEPLEEQDAECANCFKDARKKFNEQRYLFERLATIYKCTKKFSEAAIAFGDNTSGVHAVAGMAWQAERVKIEKSVKDLQAAYDNKYAELLQSLADSMMELNICEAKYGVEDWYDRFGYMYFEFMKEKYQRKD